MARPVPTKAFLQPTKTAAMSMACHDYAHTLPLIPSVLLVAPTDNIRPKLHDEYTHSQWLKG